MWEYLCEDFKTDGDELDQSLNALGGQGWELVAVVPGKNQGVVLCFFKREKVKA